MKHYRAPWSVMLIVISTVTTVLCLAITGSIWLKPMLTHETNHSFWWGALPLALVLGAAPFTIRGYTLTPDAILIHRLFWATRLPRAGLLAAMFNPAATRGSLRICGNGGLFSFTGWFWNRQLGTYRAFVTDSKRIVVLRYARRTVVISPAAPAEFVQDLRLS